MITGRVPIGIAYCPQCGREVYLNSLYREEVEISPELLPASQYQVVHRVGVCPEREVHRWTAERIELRRVFAMELVT